MFQVIVLKLISNVIVNMVHRLNFLLTVYERVGSLEAGSTSLNLLIRADDKTYMIVMLMDMFLEGITHHGSSPPVSSE